MTQVESGPATASGVKLYIGTTLASASLDTYVEVAQTASIPDIGRVYDVIKFRPVSSRATMKFKGGYDDGDLEIMLGKDLTNAGQAALKAARDVDANYNFKIVDNDDVAVATATVTISNASPGVITWTAHGLVVDTAVVFTSAGTLPAGLTAGVTYYVKTVLSADTFTVALTKGGTVIDTTDAGSGVHTGTTVPAGSYMTFKAQVTSFATVRGDGTDIIKAKAMLATQSGTLTEQVHLP